MACCGPRAAAAGDGGFRLEMGNSFMRRQSALELAPQAKFGTNPDRAKRRADRRGKQLSVAEFFHGESGARRCLLD